MTGRALRNRAERASARAGGGFTLIELLVVIAIISLLVGILVPVVSMAIRKAEDSKSYARVKTLGQGCVNYYTDNDNYYPGQRHPDMLTGTSNPTGPYTGYTGSEVLALCMLTDNTLTPFFPHSKYADYRPDEDFYIREATRYVPGTETTDRIPAPTLMDRTSRAKAILYYPARLGVSGVETVASPYGGGNLNVFREYKYQDNDEYSGKTRTDMDNFARFACDPRFHSGSIPVQQITASDRPRGPGEFLVIAAGMDRLYFTTDDLQWRD